MFQITMKKYLPILLFTAALSTSAIAPYALAQDPTMQPPKTELKDTQISDDVIPVISADESDVHIDTDSITHPPLRMTPDKSEIIRISKNVGSVIIGNPAHLNIFVDNAKMLVAVPRMPGASFFTILDENGNVIMQRHVIVASPTEKYVRIRRTCGDGNCQPTSVYYCPDMCHEIALPETTSDGGQGAEAVGEEGSGNAPSGDNAAPPPPPVENGM